MCGMFDFLQNNKMPTKRALEERYKCKMDRFPFGEKDDCCCEDEYPSDFISHRMKYHKLSLKETMKELDQFMKEIKERHEVKPGQLK